MVMQGDSQGAGAGSARVPGVACLPNARRKQIQLIAFTRATTVDTSTNPSPIAGHLNPLLPLP
jgi:hypothetical protein